MRFIDGPMAVEHEGERVTLLPGMLLYGFVGGLFGRDHYYLGGVPIEAVGIDWLVVRTPDGPSFACDDTRPNGWTCAGLIETSKALYESADWDYE